jgi:hypothetical protein
MRVRNEQYYLLLYINIMNTADFHLVVRTDDYGQTHKMWYLKVYKSMDLQTGNVEWVERSNKYQTITITKNRIYNLSTYSLGSGADIGAATVTHATLFVFVNKWHSNNIAFFISFHESIEEAVKAKNAFGGYHKSEIYSYVVELKDNERVCLNTLCKDIQSEIC